MGGAELDLIHKVWDIDSMYPSMPNEDMVCVGMNQTWLNTTSTTDYYYLPVYASAWKMNSYYLVWMKIWMKYLIISLYASTRLARLGCSCK